MFKNIKYNNINKLSYKLNYMIINNIAVKQAICGVGILFNNIYFITLVTYLDEIRLFRIIKQGII